MSKHRHQTYRCARRAALLAVLTLSASCARIDSRTNAITSSALGPIAALEIHGYQTENPICQFRPNASEVGEFFAHAIVISRRVHHDRYDVWPCSAHGELQANERWRWTLNAGGSAELASASGDHLLLADPAQASDPR